MAESMSVLLEASAPAVAAAPRERERSRFSLYAELTKPGITRLVALTAAAGFYLGSRGGIDVVALVNTIIGTGLASSGSCALNHYLERDADARMRRTKNRPIPSGRVTPAQALVFSIVLGVAGVAYLLLTVNVAAAAVVAATYLVYDFVYTPLKRRSSIATLVGAIPGALPILAGWAAAGGSLASSGGWALFAILFLWQIPHFLALAWLFREDYERGGFVMLPLTDPDGASTAFQSLNYAVGLVLVSVAPTLLGLTGNLYMGGALLLGGALLALSCGVLRERTNRSARRLFMASVVYLPALLLLMVVDKM